MQNRTTLNHPSNEPPSFHLPHTLDRKTSRRIISRQIVLSHLLAHAKWVTITDLCHTTGLSRPTLDTCLKEFHKLNVVETKKSTLGDYLGGPKPKLYRLNPNHHQNLLLRANFHFVEGEIRNALHETTYSTRVNFSNPNEIITAFSQTLANLLAHATAPIHVTAVVVMGITHQNKVILSGRFPVIENNHWIEKIRSQLNQAKQNPELLILNDAKIAATWMDKQLRAQGENPKLLLAIHYTETPGCGIIVEGKLIEGVHGAAGEVLIEANDHWENLTKFLDDAQAKTQTDIRDVFTQVGKNPEKHQDFLQKIGDKIGHALSTLILTIDPDIVVLGGAISECGQIICTSTQQAVNQLSPTPPTVKIAPLGISAVMDGAALHAAKQAEEKILATVLQV